MNTLNQVISDTEVILENLKASLRQYNGYDELTQYLDISLNDLAQIQKKLNDPNFYIGIVGGFSSGKTTFVNAFIEGETLATDVNQGTTCVGTYVLRGEQNKVIVNYKDGTTQTWPNHSLLSNILKFFGKKELPLEQFIKEKTAYEQECQRIESVNFYTPSTGLPKEIVLLDTPGLGSTNPRHTELATKIAQKKSDALLVLTSVHQPLSSELISFIRKITQDDPSGCIFIGTFKDQISAQELQRQQIFFVKKLKSIFGDMYEPQVYFVSAYYSLLGLKEQSYADATIQFREFKQNLFWFLEPRKNQLVNQKLSLLIKNTIKSLHTGFKIQKEYFFEDIKRIAKTLEKNINLKTLGELSSNMIREFNLEKQCVAQEIEMRFNQVFTNLDSTIKFQIFSCSSSSDLKKFLKDNLNILISNAEVDLRRVTSNRFQLLLNNLGSQKLNKFNNEIKKRYESIRGKQNLFDNVFNRGYFLSQLTFLSETYGEGLNIRDELRKDGLINVGGMLLGGAALGTLILPGIGTAVGAAVGFIASLFSDLDDKKNDAYDKIKEVITDTRRTLIYRLREDLKIALNGAEIGLKKQLSVQIQRSLSAIDEFNKEKTYQIDRIKALEVKLENYEEELSKIILRL